jgi:hypothetical protein
LLQYGFVRKRTRDNSVQNDQISDNENNPDKDIKESRINDSKTFKLKWLAEFSWLRYDENQQKKMHCTLCMRHKKKTYLLLKF